MPFYDYLCSDCNFQKEELRNSSGRNITQQCPHCRSGTLRPIISGSFQINRKETWRPKSDQEKLTGPQAKGPGLQKGKKTSVLASNGHKNH